MDEQSQSSLRLGLRSNPRAIDALLDGRYTDGHLNRDWAAVRLIEWAPYKEMIQRLGYKALVENWPRWRQRLRSAERKRSLDFLVEWLPKHHPELLV